METSKTLAYHLNWPDSVQAAIQEARHEGKISAVRRALQLIQSIPADDRGPGFKVSIARTFTLEAQVDAISLALSTLPCQPEIQLGELGNIETLLLDSKSQLLDPRPDAVVVLWRLEDLYPSLVEEGMCWAAAKREEATRLLIERIRALCENYLLATTAPLFLATLPDSISYSLSDLHAQNNLKETLLRLNLEIFQLAAKHHPIRIFDFAGWQTRVGQAAFDERMNIFAKQPISSNSFFSFADELRRTLRPLVRSRAKVLALDLDNTLWGGVLGEDGIGDLKIGYEYPGNVYRSIQHQIAKLKNEGILLVLLSKNNLELVQEAFEKLPGMLLRLSDFSSVRVNWRSKYENLKEVAAELNLGLDTFVFVDDHPVEREEMTYYCPEVKVLPITHDPLVILRVLRSVEFFDAYHISDEDRYRVQDYERQKERRIPQNVQSVEDFLKSLEMRVHIAPVNEATLPRVMQMLSKTNQFNVTTRRHNESSVRLWLNSKDNFLLTLSLSDRFGDQGIVGLLIAIGEHGREKLKVDTFLLSCRVIGRGVEKMLWEQFTKMASAANYKVIDAEYISTEKNGLVSDLFNQLGMQCVEDNHQHRRYKLSLPAALEAPNWINLV